MGDDLKVRSSEGQVFSLSLNVARRFGTLGNMLQDLDHHVTDLNEIISLPKVNSRNVFYFIYKNTVGIEPWGFGLWV